MIRVLDHRITLDEVARDRNGFRTAGWQAVCECGWESDVWFFEDFDGIDTPDEFIDPAQQAWDAAEGAAQAHVEAVS